jgi:C-terminal processing protease CtpA/Prc
VQEVYVPGESGGAALKLTVGQYYTPSGAPVAPREGRRPDRLVPSPSAPVDLASDPQVQAARAWMTAL